MRRSGFLFVIMGPIANFVLAGFLYGFAYMGGLSELDYSQARIGTVIEGRPAAVTAMGM